MIAGAVLKRMERPGRAPEATATGPLDRSRSLMIKREKIKL